MVASASSSSDDTSGLLRRSATTSVDGHRSRPGRSTGSAVAGRRSGTHIGGTAVELSTTPGFGATSVGACGDDGGVVVELGGLATAAERAARRDDVRSF